MDSEIKPFLDRTDSDIELNELNESKESLLSNGKEAPLKHLSKLDLFYLTIALAGVQFTWSVELAYGTPYLLSLGLPKSLTALVWLAGPLSGLIIQPLIGFYSDRCTSKYGRRRPYIIAGTLLVVCSILFISYSKEIGSFLAFGGDSQTITIWIAVIAFYGLDFAINVVQACCRALSIDVSPGDQQNDASIWASRMIGIGNIFGYFMGFIDLKSYLPFLGSTQLKCLCIIANAVLIITVALTCIKTEERVLSSNIENYDIKWYTPLVNIVQSMSHLPGPIQKICNVQFWSWIGWFPFLFYTTAWINYIYFKNNSSDGNEEEATRTGSFALLIYSIISLIASFILPSVKYFYDSISSDTPNDPQTFYRKVLVFSEIFLALVFFSTIGVSKVWHAVAIISLCGISWAVSMWVPFALIGEYLEIYNANQDSKNDDEEESDKLSSGIILGIHNMYVVLPQFVVTFLSSIFFALIKILEIQEDNFDSFGWVLRFGGIGAIISTFLVPKINFKVKRILP
ncbi:MFS general substrate transporter [Anaeromyces robustus]|uniref:MFS general substrate transporter n=1 Tax=Anaeromyces robustus TaxID=1754192 RepID=A0A1Y1XK25_9FUNG|nr:MFS general substrate transporter [Anaeromyces robustus]|eukprot:ORX86098.1 MFS general substrate transporter [Anaeromyces robustus]